MWIVLIAEQTLLFGDVKTGTELAAGFFLLVSVRECVKVVLIEKTADSTKAGGKFSKYDYSKVSNSWERVE